MSTTAQLAQVWAQTPAGVIASDGDLPWDVPEDFAHFRATVKGHPIIVGRATWDSMPPAWRRNRTATSVVITRGDIEPKPGLAVAHSMDQAVQILAHEADPERWIIGGGQIYQLGMAVANLLVVSEIDVPEPTGTLTLAPRIDPDLWREETPGEVAGWRTSATGTRWRIRHYLRQGEAHAGTTRGRRAR